MIKRVRCCCVVVYPPFFNTGIEPLARVTQYLTKKNYVLTRGDLFGAA